MKSIRTKILIAVISVFIAANLCIAAAAYLISNQELEKAVFQDMQHLVQGVANQVAEINETRFSSAEALAALSEIRGDLFSVAEKNAMLSEAASSDDEVIRIQYYEAGDKSVTVSETRYIEKPWLDEATGSLIAAYAVPVHDLNNKLKGEVISYVKGDFLCNVVSKINVGAYNPYVINFGDGKVVGSSVLEQVSSGISVLDDASESIAYYMTKVVSGEKGYGYCTLMAANDSIIAYCPVGDNCPWAVSCFANKADFFGGLAAINQILVIVSVVWIAVGIILLEFILRRTLRPLKKVDDSIHEIAKGNADLTQRIDVKTKDEIGSVVEGFNQFTEKMQNIIGEIKEATDNLGQVGGNLDFITSDTASAITEITSTISSVNDRIASQSVSVEQTAGAVNEIASNIESLERMIENQVSGVTEASAAVEQMIGNIGSVNTSVEKMAVAFGALQSTVQIGTSKQQDVNERIKEIEAQSQMLQEANLVIANIASQTNLLAMNAAIEAAHAGDSGKGFSVVADEIRKLSETSTAQSKTISEQLTNITDAISGVVLASGESNSAFMTVSDKITETDEIVRQIKGAMEEQTAGSKQISEALHSMNDSTMEVRTASHEMAEGNKTILEGVTNLQNATVEMKEGMTEMLAGTRKVNDTGVALNEIAEKVRDSIKRNVDQVALFKV